MRKIVALFLSALVLLMAEQNVTKEKFDIDAEIAKIMKAPPSKRRILMNELKRKIFKLNLELQSSHLLHLQNILNSNHVRNRGKR
ncbi:MAG: hypothetical protein C6H99_04510 [Epsilonproteobacteria bacterium]|nr:hypothetical protein [Campylobacterota bacterium]NPA63629.1 hypothetical protein [Campylobacterota bacterium]